MSDGTHGRATCFALREFIGARLLDERVDPEPQLPPELGIQITRAQKRPEALADDAGQAIQGHVVTSSSCCDESGTFQQETDSGRQPFPVLELQLELTAPIARQAVELRVAADVR